jgi:hypothetical protein
MPPETSAREIKIGTVVAEGYIIKKATIFIDSSEDIENPGSVVDIKLVADMVWINRACEHWEHNITLQLDIDREKFLKQGKVIEIINGQKIFNKIMAILVGSIKMT